ncbi:hypothetical protein CWB99_11455 [Pseudoalteromonas rubra]|uniref:Uncharacterized protein n=1 Tax=Pseudoalteromonas rubra TaxID=43658 RepID=A0A5S3WLT5_9GAMM|nr:hypothetical protein [Pseudoalteromonas rubra]TMP28523.1 hypothetical protein CWB99_11455 [Pseudoalteromonas rubra]TMP30490.1 hypothetical protein CWC00_16575 [Pseudoalteromonas rubra]
MKTLASILISAVSLGSNLAYAWDSQVTGKVGSIEVHSPKSSAKNITISIVGETKMCTLPTNNDTAYIQKSSAPDTYEAMISVLLSAKATGDNVRLYINHGTEGCQVHRVDLL